MVNNFGESLLSSMLGKAKDVGTSYQEDVASKAAARLAEMKEKRLAAMGITKEMIGKGYTPMVNVPGRTNISSITGMNTQGILGGMPSAEPSTRGATPEEIASGDGLTLLPPEVKDTTKKGFTIKGGKLFDVMTGAPLPADADFSRYENMTPKDTSRLENKDAFAVEHTLSESFRKDAGDFPKIRDASRRIEVAAKDPSAAGDLALIYNFMRMQDPTSTIRESEFLMAQKAGNWSDQIEVARQRIVSGQRLTPEMRADFTKRASMLYGSALEQHKGLEKQYTDMASRYGANPKNVVLNFESMSSQPTATASTPSPIKSKYANIGLE